MNDVKRICLSISIDSRMSGYCALLVVDVAFQEERQRERARRGGRK